MDLASLRGVFAGFAQSAQSFGPDYHLAAVIGRSYAAKARSGHCAIVVPLAEAPCAVGRACFGCNLTPADAMRFEFDSREWTQPAAILECTEPELLETFVVLAHDVALRLSGQTDPVHWRDVVALVSQWQDLLGARKRLSPEEELGLWAEVWFITQSTDPDRLIRAWRGPDSSPVDFVLDGIGAEIKASQTRLAHNVSRTQAKSPLGGFDSYLVSCWVTLDPVRGETLPTLVDRLLATLSDPAELLRRLLEAGYVHFDRVSYDRPLVVLDEAWFAAKDVPQVRDVDPGITQLRYRVALDEARRQGAREAAILNRHFGRTTTIALPDHA